MASIKSQTLEQIEQVLKQDKKYYRSNEFGFPTNKNGYSTHQGAVLRHYLREHGYVNVRVSEVSLKFFTDYREVIKASLKGKPIGDLLLKPSNTIIIKSEDYLQYCVPLNFNKENFKKNLLQYPTRQKSEKQTVKDLVEKHEELLVDLLNYKNDAKALMSSDEMQSLNERLEQQRGFIKDLKELL